jgi:prepilin-type N-terminal cleavage/methylation domain-containing protein
MRNSRGESLSRKHIRGAPLLTDSMKGTIMQTKNEGGFTLVELLLVIVILGILAAIVVAAVGNTSTQAATNACRAEIKTIRSSIQRYIAATPGANLASVVDNASANGAPLSPTYLADSINQGGSNYTITVANGVVSGTTAGGAC